MHQTNETQVTILTSLLRILVALSFCGYNDLGIIYHLCNLFSAILGFVKKHRIRQ